MLFQKNKTILILFSTLLIHFKSVANIDLHQGGGHSKIGITDDITRPMQDNIDTVYNFTITILVLIALVVALKVYNRWQLGGEDVLPEIYRWIFGLVICFAIVTFLKYFIAGQDFAGFTPPDIF